MAKKTKPKSKSLVSVKAKKTVKSAPKKAIKPVLKAKNAKPAVKASIKPAKKDAKISAPKKDDIKKGKTDTQKIDKKAVKDIPLSKVSAAEADKAAKIAAKSDVKQQVKPAAKALSKVKAKAKKVEKKEDDFDDDLINDDFGESEIAEYEDDLKAVEEDEDDIGDDLSDDEELDEKETEVYLTDSEGRRLCRVRDCDQVTNVEGYCRYHYLLLWQKIQIRKSILLDNKLEKYIENLTTRYPDKFLEMIRKDMKSEKDFLSAIQELEIDESAMGDSDATDDDAQSFADEIRGVADAPVMDDDSDF